MCISGHLFSFCNSRFWVVCKCGPSNPKRRILQFTWYSRALRQLLKVGLVQTMSVLHHSIVIGSNDCHIEWLKNVQFSSNPKQLYLATMCRAPYWCVWGSAHVHLKCLHYKVKVRVTPTWPQVDPKSHKWITPCLTASLHDYITLGNEHITAWLQNMAMWDHFCNILLHFAFV